mmetsp:Transcript_47897/g.74792  ORF Transcript_47897/g.74792 Transcript_47897/m.74792 type:complete len:622 (-) Transcript_47897:949-2814(-)
MAYILNEKGQKDFLEEKLNNVITDYQSKYALLKKESDEMIEAEREQRKQLQTELMDQMEAVADARESIEETLHRERESMSHMKAKLPDTERQLKTVMKAYNEQLKDLHKMMEATNSSSVPELIQRFRGMVHVQAMWDMESRLQEEKQQLKEQRDILMAKLQETKEALVQMAEAKQQAENKISKLTTYSDSVCRFLPAQFPEAQDLKLINSKLYWHDPEDEKFKECNLKPALMSLRKSLDVIQEKADNTRAALAHAKALLNEREDTGEEWHPSEFFDGLGDKDEVPTVLRWQGKIMNRNLSRAQTEKAVLVLFKKREAEQKREGTPPLTINSDMTYWQLLSTHVSGTFGAKQACVEWAYSFIDGLKKYKETFNIRSMHLILEGKMEEEMYYGGHKLIDNLFERLKSRDAQVHKPPTGKLPKKEFVRVVDHFFTPKSKGGHGHYKGKTAMEDAIRELATDEKAGTWGVAPKEIDFVKLLAEAKDGTQSCFVEKLLYQFYTDRQQFIRDIGYNIERNRPESKKITTSREVGQSIRKIDPEKPVEEIDEIVKSIFGRKSTLPNEEVARRLGQVQGERTTDRGDKRVIRQLRPKSQLLRLAERKVRHVALCLRVASAFLEAGKAYR